MQEQRKIYKDDLTYINRRLAENNLTNYGRMSVSEFMQAQAYLPKPNKIKELSPRVNVVEYSDNTMKLSYATHRGKMFEFYYIKEKYVQN